ncbi:pyruvate dehydrogenase (acetyl-transferring) E1 component subunit alpha [Streptomyces sp. NPDC002559]
MTVESTAARTPRRSSKRTSAAKTTAKAPAETPTPAKKPVSTPAKKSAGTTAKAPAKRTAAKKTAARTAAAKAPQRSEPELVQLLTPEGERVEHPDYSIDLTADELRGLYRDMVLTRRFDAEATALQRQGELGLWASLLGQEAAQIGSGRALRDDDYVFPTYREHGVAWCRGVDPTNLLGMFRGVNHGGWDPNSNNFHLYTIVIGSQTLHATGYAMGVAKDGADSAVIAYFGDGASSQGDVAESFTFSAVYNAPVVFFCQNNQWAISEPTERQTRVPLYQRAQGFGFPGIRVDGNDVLACLAVTRSALERARRGEGPTLVEAFTYRMGAHTTSDDPTKYRRDEERAAWEVKDPILRLRTYLEKQGAADEAFFTALDEESEALGKRVREVVRAMPDPDPIAIFDNVYADGNPLVDEERAQFAAYQASFADSAEKGK